MTDFNRQKKRLAQLRLEMAKLGPVMRGSVTALGAKNKQPYFSLNKDRRTRLIYLGEKRVSKAREYSGNYRRLLELVEEMTLINMNLLKNDVCD